MRRLRAAVAVMMLASVAQGAVKTKVVEYKSGDQAMIGYLAWNDATDAKRPAVLVFPEWWGNTEYSKKRAEQLAGLGYVALAVDMYGDGKATDDAKQAGEWAGKVKGDPKLASERTGAALNALKSQPMVDSERIAAIGYCFGGAMVLQMARQNMPVRGVVSFHGDLSTQTSATKVAPRVLVLTGAADQFVPAELVAKFEAEMKNAGANYKVISYPGAEHSFTNPDADRHKIPSVKYDKRADEQSWEAMKSFLSDVLK